MRRGNAILVGLVAGLVMGAALFLVGAVAAWIVYGPQMVPEGKFEPERINAWYFIWTKLMIGAFFGVLFSLTLNRLPLEKRVCNAVGGLKAAFLFWLLVSLWGLSHPLVYGPIDFRNQAFWLVYTLGGFLAYGGTLGFLFKRQTRGLSAEGSLQQIGGP